MDQINTKDFARFRQKQDRGGKKRKKCGPEPGLDLASEHFIKTF